MLRSFEHATRTQTGKLRRHLGGWVILDEPELHLGSRVVVGTSYRVHAVHVGQAVVHAEPFEAIELEHGALWAR